VSATAVATAPSSGSAGTEGSSGKLMSQAKAAKTNIAKKRNSLCLGIILSFLPSFMIFTHQSILQQ
jgi:hypothetical protein